MVVRGKRGQVHHTSRCECAALLDTPQQSTAQSRPLTRTDDMPPGPPPCGLLLSFLPTTDFPDAYVASSAAWWLERALKWKLGVVVVMMGGSLDSHHWYMPLKT
eukprot:1159590-Pelagomonas_calceolata.AAC.4